MTRGAKCKQVSKDSSWQDLLETVRQSHHESNNYRSQESNGVTQHQTRRSCGQTSRTYRGDFDAYPFHAVRDRLEGTLRRDDVDVLQEGEYTHGSLELLKQSVPRPSNQIESAENREQFANLWRPVDRNRREDGDNLEIVDPCTQREGKTWSCITRGAVSAWRARTDRNEHKTNLILVEQVCCSRSAEAEREVQLTGHSRDV